MITWTANNISAICRNSLSTSHVCCTDCNFGPPTAYYQFKNSCLVPILVCGNLNKLEGRAGVWKLCAVNFHSRWSDWFELKSFIILSTFWSLALELWNELLQEQIISYAFVRTNSYWYRNKFQIRCLSSCSFMGLLSEIHQSNHLNFLWNVIKHVEDFYCSFSHSPSCFELPIIQKWRF